MAIQNFIGGSFKGKLGAVVGQGWKNKHVLKTYSKPANPRTKRQQSNRGNFAQCVQMAQLAMQMNFNSPAFTSESTPEWGQRIGTARKLYTANLSIYHAIPLLPYGTIAKYGVKEDFDKGSNVLTFYVDTEDNVVGRSMSVLLHLLKTGTEEYEDFISQSQVSLVGTDYIFTAEIPTGYEVAENSIMCAVSNDDVEVTTIIYRPTMSIYSPVVNIPFTLSNPSITPIATGVTKRAIAFTPSVSLESATIDIGGVVAQGVLQGLVKSATGTVVSASTNSISIEIDTNVTDSLSQCMQFPTGSEVTIPAFSFTVGNNRYVYSGGDFGLSETVVQQDAVFENFFDIDITGQSMGIQAKDFVANITGAINSQNIKIPIVQNEAVVLKTVNITQITSAQTGLATDFFTSENGWGKERNATATLNDLYVTANGVTYDLGGIRRITVEPNFTSKLITGSSISPSMSTYRTSSGTEFATFELYARSIDAYVGLFTSDVLPTAVTIVAPTKTWQVTGFQNCVITGSNSITSNFTYDWRGAYEDEPKPTFETHLRQTVESTSIVPNTDGFVVGLRVTPSETLSGKYSSWDNY